MSSIDRLTLFDVDEARAAKIAASLAPLGLEVGRCHRPSEAREALRRDRPAVAVVVGARGDFAGLAEAARDQGVATLGVLDPPGDPMELLDRVRAFDAWASIAGAPAELPARVAGLLERAGRRRASEGPAPPPAIDSRFLALVVHDLRTPLNVIGLTIRAISQSNPQRTPEFEEDLTFLVENARQIEKMLAQLGDYCRLIDAESQISGTEFDPRRFLSDFLEDRQGRHNVEPTPVRLEILEGSPAEVSLDPIRVRLALQHALANAVAAAGDSTVRLRSSGKPGAWVIEFLVEKPPPPTVNPIDLRAGSFERLAGVPAERRGLDLAIAARVTELFGGSARLEIEPGRRSVVVLEWPERLPSG